VCVHFLAAHDVPESVAREHHELVTTFEVVPHHLPPWSKEEEEDEEEEEVEKGLEGARIRARIRRRGKHGNLKPCTDLWNCENQIIREISVVSRGKAAQKRKGQKE
jgi:hypothetical protein